jgi:hypothetical protein
VFILQLRASVAAHGSRNRYGFGQCLAYLPIRLSASPRSREFGITLPALRFYEAKRLIAPERQGATRL